MPIVLPSGFQITSTDPIDSRITVADQTERLGFSEYNVYNGLLVFQRDTNELYVLTNTGSHTSNTGWQLVGSGSGGSVDTGSLMTTASVANNVITFTKGDTTTFDVTVDTGSVPAGTVSSSVQITDLGFVQSSITASSLDTASVNLNEITFTKGDGSTFAVTIDTGSVPAGTVSSSVQITDLGFVQSSITASSLDTASVNLNEITFTKGDGSTFAVTIDTGSVPAGTVSSSAQITNLGFINETITSSMSVASASVADVAVIATYTSEWTLGANGSSDYTFTGPGLIGAENDPTIYLIRGQQYKFTNNMNAHPFRIQSTPNGSTGTAYNDGITNNNVSNGTLLWNVQFDSPDTLYYQCTAHPSMGGKIVIIDSGALIPSGTVSSSAQITNLGFVQSSITASSLDTASVNLNEITFTKGDGSTFAVTIDTGSVPAGTLSSSSQITNLGFVQSSITASSLDTASVNLNEITFTKGDGSTFAITVDTGSIPAGTVSSSVQITDLGFVQSSITASSLETASVNLNEITFTKGDGSTFAITVDTGSGGGSGSGSANLTQELTANLTVGGVTSGESFASGSSIEALLRDMLITYQEPTVGSLNIRSGGSGVSTSVRDVGVSFTCDNATFTAGVDSPNGDYPQSASLSCTGADIGSFSENGPDNVQASNTITFSTTRTIQKTSYGSVSFSVSTDSRNSGDTQTTSISFSWQWRNYLAASSTIISSDSTLQNVINNDLVANAFNTSRSWNPTCGAANNTAGNYTYVIYPASYGDLNNIIQDGATPVLTAFTNLGNFSADNSEGITQSWRVYKSNADQAFASGTALAIS